MARAINTYWNPTRQDNHTTISPESVRDALGSGYFFVRTEGYAFESSKANTIPLKSYWHLGRGDNSLVATSVGNREHQQSGYRYVRDEGYALKNEEPGTIPLKLYWHSGRGDNFTTSSAEGERSAKDAGYTFVRIEGWVSPIPVDIVVDVRTNMGSNHFMTTKGVLMQNGHIDAMTRTETGTWFGGFTGGVQLLFADANGLTIGSSGARTYGVDGTWVGRSVRQDYWSEDIDPTIAKRTTSLHVAHFWAPDYGAVQNIVDRAVKAVRPAIDVLKEIDVL